MTNTPDTPLHLNHDHLPAWHHIADFRFWQDRADTYGISAAEAKLMDLAVLKKEIEDAISAQAFNSVHDGDDGLTWTQVGQALGVSRQAASKRYGRHN